MKKYRVISLLLLFLFGIQLGTIHSEQLDPMKVHFIDVGQGDSILIQTPNNKVILIDGGPPKAGKKIISYLEEQRIKQIDLLIATHPDIDHIGGFPYIMKEINVKQIIDSGKLHTTRTYAKYRHQIFKQKIPFHIVKEKEKIKIDATIDIQVLNAYEKKKDNNASSIVLKVTYGDIDLLLLSDIGEEQERELVRKYNVQAEIIKVAHHGSNTSSSLDFLQQVNPEVAFITYSKTNEYGHPVNRVIQNLFHINAHIYSTAVYGTIKIETDGKRYLVFPEKSPIEGLTG